MFEDIIGGVEKEEDVTIVLSAGDGIVSCPVCSSGTIFKGMPVYLLNKNTKQSCNCKSCKASWSLTYDPGLKQYIFEVAKKT